jgi:hypothetical protein
MILCLPAGYKRRHIHGYIAKHDRKLALQYGGNINGEIART